MIEVKNLSKHFADFVAVNDLSFTVSPGEVLGFLGPNGAGKSTTMKMITGFLEPDKGQVLVYGQDVSKQPLQVKQRIGYLPEGAPAYGEMTCQQFLRFIGEIRGFSGQSLDQRITDVVASVELQSVMNKPIYTLSKGFQRRVGLAQALIHDPDILILDEPTDGLDPNQKHQVRELILNLAKDKIVVVSTHILEEVTAVCSRALIIANGELLMDEEPSVLEKKSRYHNAISITFENPVPATASFAAIDEVSEVDTCEEGRHFMVFPAQGQNIYHQVSAIIDENQWPVETLHIERGRLDDVFRAITTGREV